MHTRNFLDEEFLCPCGRCQWSRETAGIVRPELMIALQAVRDRYGAAVHVVSGRRCAGYNRELTGSSNGYHVRGFAADIVAGDLDKLADAAAGVPELAYIELHDSYIHVDIGRPRGERVVDSRKVRKGGAA